VKGSAVLGASAIGIGYYQRRAVDLGDHRGSWSISFGSRFYQKVGAPIAFCLDPETAHIATLKVLELLQTIRLLSEPSWTGSTPFDSLLRPVASTSPPTTPSLRQELFDGRLRFESPVGIAAGFDKNALLVPLYRLGAWPGLGFAEVGSISALPSEGNPKPRCFRLVEDEAVVNRMGLNNEGAEAVAKRLASFETLGRHPVRAPVGVNIAKTHSPTIVGEAAVEDFATSYRTLSPMGDFVVLNVSCPNTAEGKTFEEPDTLGALLAAVSRERAASGVASPPPVLVKLSPPADAASPAGREQLQRLIETAQASGIVDGFVVSNTVNDGKVPLSSGGVELLGGIGKGGLSGKPLADRSTTAIREVYRLSGGRVPIIGVGGVDSAENAYAKIRAGASLVEVYTGMVYKGPWLFADIHVGLRRLLHRDGYASITEAIGADVKM